MPTCMPLIKLAGMVLVAWAVLVPARDSCVEPTALTTGEEGGKAKEGTGPRKGVVDVEILDGVVATAAGAGVSACACECECECTCG